MKDFDTVFEKSLNERMTTRIRVTQMGGRSLRFAGNEWQWFCLCVTGKGCKCKNPILIMIGDILDRFGTGERTDDGEEIIELVVSRDADVLQQRMSKRSISSVVASTEAGSDCDGGDDVGVAQFAPVVAGFGLFYTGLKIGKFLDDLSDGSISDALADKIQEWDDYFNGKEKEK